VVVEIDELIYRSGGVAGYRTLAMAFPRGHIEAALRAERIVRIGRGCYALPGGDEAARAARALTGVLSVTSAALHWGWQVKSPPKQPHVTVPRHRTVVAHRRRGVALHFADVEVDGIATSPVQTVLDCARHLPFDEALAVADSALRSGLVGPTELATAAVGSPRSGRARAIKVAQCADKRADNPFESVVRAISYEYPGLQLIPQVTVAGLGRPDLYDRHLGLVVECDSFQFHSGRSAVVHDVERYNACTQLSLSLLRFAWEHAMLRQDYVRDQFAGWLETHGLAVHQLRGSAPA
jgi:hypothetical protein